MHDTGTYALVTRPGYRAIRLPYGVDKLSMAILLPDEIGGIDSLAGRIGIDELSDTLGALRDAQARRKVDLALPRFKVEFKAELIAPFRQAGMTRAFNPEAADFTGMSGPAAGKDKGLFISQILHRAVVEIAEEHTEAAAATAVEMSLRGTPARPVRPEPFRVDHPFLFFIVDDASGAVLFQGRVSDPHQSPSQ